MQKKKIISTQPLKKKWQLNCFQLQTLANIHKNWRNCTTIFFFYKLLNKTRHHDQIVWMDIEMGMQMGAVQCYQLFNDRKEKKSFKPVHYDYTMPMLLAYIIWNDTCSIWSIFFFYFSSFSEKKKVVRSAAQ